MKIQTLHEITIRIHKELSTCKKNHPIKKWEKHIAALYQRGYIGGK